MAYNQKDYYFNKAKKEGFRARSSYKLIEIAKKYQLIQKNDAVLDIGCAPGSWLQVIKQMTRGRIVGVDLVSIKPIEGVTFIQGDIEDTEVKKFQSQETEDLVKEIKPHFSFVKRYSPQSTRQGSKEIYIVATGFKL